MKIVIVGGVAGGASAAARLRRLDEQAEILLLEKGPHISFANCGLPYYIGDVIKDQQELLLNTPASFEARHNVSVRIMNEVTEILPDKKQVVVLDHTNNNTTIESYDKLILSPGAAPVKPPIPGIDLANVFTLRTVEDAQKIKDHLAQVKKGHAVVIGGGFIGIEMAENLKIAGFQTTMVEASDHLLPPFDRDMASTLHQHLVEKGIRLLLNNPLVQLAEADGSLQVQLKTQTLEADFVILAIGVRPDTALAKNSGLALNSRGAIIVNEQMQTSDPHIYAVGDAIEITEFVSQTSGYIPLAGPANKQGRIAADHIAGLSSRYLGTQGSSVLKAFDMTFACTGLSETAAKRTGMPYHKVYLSPASHAGYYPGGHPIWMKVLYHPDSGKILGAQLAGADGVDKRCDILATVIRLGGTAHDLTQLELCYAPPYGSAKDAVNMAGYVIENVLDGPIQNFDWQELPALKKRSDVTLLDIRTPREVEETPCAGSISIPLDTLRQRIGELDPQKPVYILCYSGLRSYLACRILAQHGFTCYNLSGGLSMYRLFEKDYQEFPPVEPTL